MASNIMDEQVTVTLSSVGESPDAPLATRSIRLSHMKPVPIGRASKVEAKGFVATDDNAWFNSAVMSRNHAEIDADVMEKLVRVTDRGSLHGTYVNSHRILAETPTVLQNGDSVDFGVPIQRNNEEFPPTRVRVNFEFKDQASEQQPRVYRPPESIDDSSDDDSVIETGPPLLSAMGEGFGRVGLQIHHHLSYSVDNLEQSSPVVDLTGSPLITQAALHQPVVNEACLTDLEPAESTDSAMFSDPEVWAGNDDDDAHELSDSSSIVDSDSYADNHWRDEGRSDISDDGEDDELDMAGLSCDDDDDEDDDHPLAGHHAGLIWDDPDSDIDIPDDLDDFDNNIVEGTSGTEAPATIKVPPQDGQEMKQLSIPALLNPTGVNPKPAPETSAMFSTVLNPKAAPETSAMITAIQNSTLDPPMAELGISAGKLEYFEARAANRAAVYRTAAVDPLPVKKDRVLETTDETLIEVDPVEVVMTPAIQLPAIQQQEVSAGVREASEARIEPQIEPLITTALLEEGDRFLNSPPAEGRLVESHSEDEDDGMTSAATYLQHKLEKAKDTRAKLLEKVKDTRTKLVESHSEDEDDGMTSAATYVQHKVEEAKQAKLKALITAHADSSKKRKAESISEEAPVVAPLTPESEKEQIEMPVADAERPAKRTATEAAKEKAKGRGTAWAVVERMGIAALGGAMGGAMVLGSLIYSAPAL